MLRPRVTATEKAAEGARARKRPSAFLGHRSNVTLRQARAKIVTDDLRGVMNDLRPNGET